MQFLRTMSMMSQINLYTLLLLFTLRIVLFLCLNVSISGVSL